MRLLRQLKLTDWTERARYHIVIHRMWVTLFLDDPSFLNPNPLQLFVNVLHCVRNQDVYIYRMQNVKKGLSAKLQVILWQREQCLIYNGTLKSYVWSSMNKYSCFSFFKLFIFIYQSVMLISHDYILQCRIYKK